MKNSMTFYVFLGINLLLTYLLQNLIDVHGDVSYLIYITKLMFNGETYGKEIFETNPPMILYLYSPIVWLVNHTSINTTLILRLYILTLVGISSSVSYSLLKRIIDDPIVRISLLFGIMLSLLFFPVNQFGQREHFLLIFLFPYIFANAALLQGHKISKYSSFMINFAAGIGFCIKPYFIFIFLLINIFIAIKQKKKFGWINASSVMISLMMLTYLVTSYLFFPGYFYVVLPLVNQFYFPGIHEPWLVTFTNPSVIFCLSILVAYFMLKKFDRYPILGGLLFFSLVGANLTFLVTRTSWYEHITPAIGLGNALLFFLLGQFLSQAVHQHERLELRALSSAFLLSFTLIMLSPLLEYAYTSYNELNSGVSVTALHELESFISSSPKSRSINCFSANTTMDCFPLVENTKSIYGSRYPFFWWMRGLYFFPNQQGYQYLIESVAEDLEIFKPHWIIINFAIPKFIFGEQFDFVTYFSSNEHFKKAWKTYRFVKSIYPYNLYERLDFS